MAYTKGGKQRHKIPYCGRIAAKVKEMAVSCTVTDIFSSIQHYQNAPASLTTFYKLYRADLDAAKGKVTQEIGDKVVNAAINGDEESPLTHKAREFYLERKGGWSKKETLETREVGSEDEENEGAVNALLVALGKATDDDEE